MPEHTFPYVGLYVGKVDFFDFYHSWFYRRPLRQIPHSWGIFLSLTPHKNSSITLGFDFHCFSSYHPIAFIYVGFYVGINRNAENCT